ncbi:MAG TPA: hypothetical protein P5519_08235 [Spirochaetia bacterium]|nr:hypothetical protein [Spirochaetales bacterium]HOT59521.1 hypothetical protein [Spirochaetales bacterium]HQK33426.1 hypothetical protein [Spirochaetales bacterium]HRS65864.1 hypothetical protein [Spirochaetia bacterium]HRV29362.1 hypothetical protein [Spirochaetia bacterium]
MDYPVSLEKTRQYGVRGIFATVGGIAALIVGNIIAAPIIGPVIGGILAVTGIYQFFRKKNEVQASAVVSLGVGALGIATLFAKHLVKGFASLAGVGLIGFGIYNIVQFVRALKSRS